jgi:hypothetical protein
MKSNPTYIFHDSVGVWRAIDCAPTEHLQDVSTEIRAMPWPVSLENEMRLHHIQKELLKRYSATGGCGCGGPEPHVRYCISKCRLDPPDTAPAHVE